MANYHGVLVCSEVVEGKTAAITRELLNIGRRLSDDLSQPLSTLLVGKDIQETAKEVITLGADKVYTIDSSPFVQSPPDLYVAIFAQVCQQVTPSIVLLGQTDMGRDVAPRLAARLGTAVAMDCTELAIDSNTKCLLQTKPVYGGNAKAVWVSESHEPHIVTLRPRAVMPAEPDASRKGEIITLSVTVDDSMIKSKLVETVKEEIKGIKLEEAQVIVAGGGGIGGGEGFKLLKELAEVVEGTVGVTRVPCDEGWMPTSLEIGQTGHIVSPNLYIAVGISGAPQHMAGCSGSKCIVAINRDSEAHIFKEADFGLVGDYREVLPTLIEKCKTLVK
jgi:electron transfer flavoprotein alpha subunit